MDYCGGDVRNLMVEVPTENSWDRSFPKLYSQLYDMAVKQNDPRLAFEILQHWVAVRPARTS
jgi:hypothetical protein